MIGSGSHLSACVAEPVADDGEEQLVLAREIAIEGLEGHSGFLREFLGGERVALRLDQTVRRVENRPNLILDARP